MARLPLAIFMLFVCGGCIMPAALEVPAALLSLGSLGNTAVTAYYALGKPPRTAVARMPDQYRDNRKRMLLETWESGYQLAKAYSWEEPETPWLELVHRLDREGAPLGATLILVSWRYSHQEEAEEDATVYIFQNGTTSNAPNNSKPFYAETRSRTVSRAVLEYRA